METFQNTMDTFYEQLVSIRKTPTTWGILALIWIGAFCLVFLLVLFSLHNPALMGILILLVFGTMYGAGKLVRQFDIEYEYIVTNIHLDVDKIIAKNSRKRLVSVKLNEIEEYGTYNAEKAADLSGRSFNRKVVCCNPEDDAVYMISRHPKSGLMLIVLAPNERLTKAILKSVPRMVIR